MPRTSNGTTLSQQQIDPSILNDYLKSSMTMDLAN